MQKNKKEEIQKRSKKERTEGRKKKAFILPKEQFNLHISKCLTPQITFDNAN
jgi:hypothetical protein